MTDVSSCNTCHEKLALARRRARRHAVLRDVPQPGHHRSQQRQRADDVDDDPQDPRRASCWPASPGGEHYTIWGYSNIKYDYSEVGFPQDLRNCAKCHSAQQPGDAAGRQLEERAVSQAGLPDLPRQQCRLGLGRRPPALRRAICRALGASAKDLPNADCARCHAAGTDFGPDVVHWNQIEVNSALYKMNIESATSTTRPTTRAAR